MSIIKLQDLTPKPYYEQSRDFQFIGRLYDIVLNNIKLNADLLYNMPLSEESNKQLLDLLTMTLGFKQKHHYNIKQLTALCSAFCEILKNKGNIKSLELAINAFMNAEGIQQKFHYSIDENDPAKITIAVPTTLSDINLLRDLLDYILPAGMSCDIIRATYVESDVNTELNVQENITSEKIIDITNRSILATSDNKYYNTPIDIGQTGLPGMIGTSLVEKTIKTQTDEEKY